MTNDANDPSKSGWQKVAGGRSEAKTSGINARVRGPPLLRHWFIFEDFGKQGLDGFGPDLVALPG